MSSPRPRRLLAVAAAVAAAITLAACGSDGSPSTDPTTDPTGQGQFGEVTATPTGDTTTAPTSTATTPGGSGGGGGGSDQYPTDPVEYGLAFLRAIADGDDARIVDLSNLTTAQRVQSENYKAKNGQWTNTHCEFGVPNTCYYYNQTGDIATVTMEGSQVGHASAVLGINIDGANFPTDAGGYVQAFIRHWINGSTVGMRAYANEQIVSFVEGKPTPNGGFTTTPTSCGSGRMCLDSGRELAGGQPFGDIIHWVVDTTKLGKPNAIISASS